MIGASWNIRSIAKKSHKQALVDVVIKHKFDFIGLQETKT